MKEILDVIHNTIYQFFDVCEKDEEVPMSDKDKLLLEVNKAICDNIKALEQESVLDKIRAEIMKLQTYKMFEGENTVYNERDDVLAIIDRYNAEEK